MPPFFGSLDYPAHYLSQELTMKCLCCCVNVNVLVFALLLGALCKPGSAEPILQGGCLANPFMCGLQPQVYTDISLVAASFTTFSTGPVTLTSDSLSLSSPTNPGASAFGSYIAAADGTHMFLTSNGGGGICEGSYCTSTSDVIAAYADYFGVAPSSVPLGSTLDVSYGIEAIGNSHVDSISLTGTLSSLKAYVNSIGNNHCDNGYKNDFITGLWISNCTASLPIPVTGVVRVDLFADGYSFSDSEHTSILDALDTIKITSVEVVDPSGNVLSNTPLYDASGYDYNAASASPVPEPRSLFLLGTGCLLMYFWLKGNVSDGRPI